MSVTGAVARRRPARRRTAQAAARRPLESGAEAVAFAAILLLGAFNMLFRLGTPSWHFDEYFYQLVGYEQLHGDTSPEAVPQVGTVLLGVLPTITSEGSTGIVRLAPALAGLGTGVVLFLFARRTAGSTAGLLTLALWLLLPHAAIMGGYPLNAVKIERFGLLDVFMVFFMTCALYAGWRWTSSWRWRWLCATAIFTGLATGSKMPGALVLVPVAALAITTPGVTRLRLLQLLALPALSALVLLLSFWPEVADAPSRLRAMTEWGRAVSRVGHPAIVAGEVYPHHQPWWSNAWFMWKGVGPAATIGLVALAGSGMFLVRGRRLSGYLAVAVIVPFSAIAFGYALALPHYYFIWMAPLTMLAALALDRMLRQSGRRLRILGAVLCVPLTVAALRTTLDVAGLREADYRAVGTELDRRGLDTAEVAVLGYGPVLRAYLPQARITSRAGDATAAIVVDRLFLKRGSSRADVAPWLRRYGAQAERRRTDRLDLYIRKPTLRASISMGQQP